MSVKSMCIFAAILVMVSGMSSAYAVPAISLDKSSYSTGDTVTLSGTLSELDPGQFVLLQVKSQNDIVTLDQFIPTSESFSKSIPAEGPNWSESGTYTVVVSYLGEKTQKTFQFSAKIPDSAKDNDSQNSAQSPKDTNTGDTTSGTAPNTAPKSATSDAENNIPQETPQPIPERPKPVISISGFPDAAKPPLYYYERYGTEPDYKKWFDSVFVGYSIGEVVGYRTTHISGFPDDTKSPQYYIDRYNAEPEYKEWFDSQFPGKTIQDIVIPPEKIQNAVPAQIKDTARMWASGSLQDSSFASAIEQLIQNGVIQNESGLVSESAKVQSIPEWVKNNAEWWSEGLITENDFLFGIEELMRRGVIEIN